MSYYANGELKVVYLTADKSIPEKVENAFLYVNQRYDYDCDISDYTTTIEAWGKRAVFNRNYREAARITYRDCSD